MKNILIINQSSELYGSDKALLELIQNFPKDYNPIVVLENEGKLNDILNKKGIKIIKCPVIKLKKSTFSFFGIIKIILKSISALYQIRKHTKNLEIDLVHSNTIAVFLGAFYSFIFRKKHLWHVHEIVENPKIAANIYPKIVSFFSDKVIFNSKASYYHFVNIYPKIKYKSEVIYNGQERILPLSLPTQIKKIKKEIFKVEDDSLIIGLVGRISRWKGQILLLEAFEMLTPKYEFLHLVFIGSTPDNQEHFLINLQNKIKEKNLSKKVTIIDFQKSIWEFYDAIDISVVPSIEPEPFGLVATEAMLSGNPIIAANHGGLSEIVVDQETGFLFEPKNVNALVEKLELLIENPELRKKMGENGRKRVEACFSTQSYIKEFEKKFQELLD